MTMTRATGALRTTFLAAVAMTAVACGDLTYPSAVKVAPTASVFAVDSYATFVVRNDSPKTIQVARCGDRVQVGLDRRVGGEWQNEMAGLCILSYYGGPFMLAPGESVTDSVLVRSAGTFRVSVAYGTGDERVLRQVESGAFTVE